MNSHEYRFRLREVMGLVLGPLFLPVAFALCMHLASILGVLAHPKPMLDVDRTILLHQAEASRIPSGANIVLIGDSSCLMDVSALKLERVLGPTNRVLNLGSLSYLNLASQAVLLRNYIQANPTSVKMIVLLMHPESLRLGSRDAYFADVLNSYLAGQDHRASNARFSWWSGSGDFKARVLSRILPAPLPGAYGFYYGFSWNLWKRLSAHNGSAIDPRTYQRQSGSGSAEYRLARTLEQDSQLFRSEIPARTRLVVGITPSPESHLLPGHKETCAQMLQQWSQWLGASGTLSLPCSLEDLFFASTTHLNTKGIEIYTDLLAQDLRPLLSGAPK
jgi:hypothetical protein